MKVQDIMTRDVKSCGPDTNLAVATEILWRNGCGTLPVVDAGGKLVGVITDRDMCIAMGTRNRRANELAVGEVATNLVFTCRPADDLREALRKMRQYQVRRVPVVDEGGRVVGLVCLDDIVMRAGKAERKKAAAISYEDVVNTMKGICEHRAAEAA